MEKRTPHCELGAVRGLILAGKVRVTFSALSSAGAIGFDYEAMLAVVVALTPDDFYKSMSTYIDDKVWQDVYRPSVEAVDLYVKLTVIDDLLIVSFKEL